MTDLHWRQFGIQLRGLHDVTLPDQIRATIPVNVLARWTSTVSSYISRIDQITPVDDVARAVLDFMREKQSDIDSLVAYAEAFAADLRTRVPVTDFVLCHADIHAWNVMLSEAGEFYIIDWDTLMFAPRERDLMFIGAGLGDIWKSEREAELFYEGYGQVAVDTVALAYYRCVRIIEDVGISANRCSTRRRAVPTAPWNYSTSVRRLNAGGVTDIALATATRCNGARPHR